jgi:hypothetical protein
VNTTDIRTTSCHGAFGFFGFVALTLALDLVDTWIKGTEYWRALGPEYPVRIIALLALCAIAAKTRNLAFHSIFVLFWLVYEASFFSRHYFSLS